MQISIDQMTTVVNTMPLKFLQERKPGSFDLYFHIALIMGTGELTGEEKRARFKKYIAGFVRATGGRIQAISIAGDRLHILVGLPQTRALAGFVSELKLVSRAFARRRLDAPNFLWREKYEAFTVSLSQIDRVRRYIRRQARRTERESYASSWQLVSSSKLF